MSTSGVCRLAVILKHTLCPQTIHLITYVSDQCYGFLQAEIAMREAGKPGMTNEEVCLFITIFINLLNNFDCIRIGFLFLN